MARRRVWHREDIKAGLRKRYGTMRSLAVAWGMNEAALTHALCNPGQRKPTARKIAIALNRSPHELWPSVFAPDPAPVSTVRDRNRATPGRANQKMGAPLI